jgi:hypothetical protein
MPSGATWCSKRMQWVRADHFRHDLVARADCGHGPRSRQIKVVAEAADSL